MSGALNFRLQFLTSEDLGPTPYASKGRTSNNNTYGEPTASDQERITAPATEAAKQWDGWGSALKPAVEFFTLCRKPLSESTIAKNVLRWGTGGINIDGCRVETDELKTFERSAAKLVGDTRTGAACGMFDGERGFTYQPNTQGRFPANLIHSGEQEVLELFPESGEKSPARFFYCAKASKKDRDEGVEWMKCTGDPSEPPVANNHPTVKPTALMAYLCRLITPPNGVVLDPYMGSGSTGKAAIREGFSFVGIELDPDYYEIAKARVNHETCGA